MGKAPAFQFYPSDWTRDLEEHPLEIEGAWIRICCKLWWAENRGTLTKTLAQWGRILRVEWEHGAGILNYIKDEEIGMVSGNLTEPNQKITVICRRMARDEKERESNRLRQKRFYHKPKPNKNITIPSSSSSSSSTSKNKQYTPVFEKFWKEYPNHGSGKQAAFKSWKKIKPADALLDKIMDSIEEHKEKSPEWQKGFIPHATTWLNQARWTAEFEEDRETESKPVVIEGEDGKPVSYEEYLEK